MATIIFDGTQNVTTPFISANDTVQFNNINAANIRSFTETNNSVQIVLNSGITLTLTGVVFASLNTADFVAGQNSNLVFNIGDANANTATANVAVGFAGNDAYTASSNGAIFYGNLGDDTLNGDNAAGTTTYTGLKLFGGQGNDSIVDFGSGSIVYGGVNTTTETIAAATGASSGFTAGGAGVTVFGGNGTGDTADGADTITGSIGNDELYGNAGNDTINGGGGRDLIYGGQGNDTINLGAGTLTGTIAYGQLGSDSVDGSAAGITAGNAGLTLYGGNSAGDAVDAADTVIGSAGNDAIYGNGGNDRLVSNGGTDSIYGGQGDDTIAGAADGTGQSTLTAGSIVYGGLGTDTINLTVAASTVTGAVTQIFGGNGLADATDGGDIITFSGTTAAGVQVFGNGGNDTITLSTASFGDTVNGGAGNDTIDAGGTAAVVGPPAVAASGGGNDVLTGGLGGDTFRFNAVASTDANSIDRITDMNFNEDKIDLVDVPTAVLTFTLANASSIADIKAAASDVDTTVTIVNVTGGSLAGSYVVDDNTAASTIINVTGFIGNADVSDFI